MAFLDLVGGKMLEVREPFSVRAEGASEGGPRRALNRLADVSTASDVAVQGRQETE